MSRFAKYIAYVILFVVSFVVFLYWVFPYQILKDRVASAIEEPLGRAVEVSIGELSPYYFTGLKISDLKLVSRVNGEPITMMEIQRVMARASFFSLIFGNPNISFYIKSGKGEIEGVLRQADEGFDIEADFNEFDVKEIKWLESKIGINLSGKIDGSIELNVDRARPARTAGKIDLSLDDFKIAPAKLNLAGMDISFPETIITKGKGSRIKVSVDKGIASLDEFRLSEGDLELDLKGKVYLSTILSNYRLNLSGTFKVSDKLNQAVPILFIAEQQKQQDGSYPLSITGKLIEPSIKIGTMTIPL